MKIKTTNINQDSNKIEIDNNTQKYMGHITSAIDKAEQALSSITYTSHSDVNEEPIKLINKAIELLEKAQDSTIYKPV